MAHVSVSLATYFTLCCAAHLAQGEYTHPAIRLVNGASGDQGRVEVFHDGVYGTVCGNHWTHREAGVVCRQLGYPAGYASVLSGRGVVPIHLDDVNCDGHESNLGECAHRGWGVHDCSHGKEVAVVCIHIRLTGGRFPYEGMVYLLFKGEYRALCLDSWYKENAPVVCRQLGFEGGYTAEKGIYHPGSRPLIHPINILCDGTEEAITQCSLSSYTSQPSEFAAVICIPRPTLNITFQPYFPWDDGVLARMICTIGSLHTFPKDIFCRKGKYQDRGSKVDTHMGEDGLLVITVICEFKAVLTESGDPVTCELALQDGKIITNSTQLQIVQLPIVHVHGPANSEEWGNTAIFTCSVGPVKTTARDVFWRHEAKGRIPPTQLDIHSEGNSTDTYFSILKYQPVPSDNGVYLYCVIITACGQEVSEAVLIDTDSNNVLYGHDLIERPEEDTSDNWLLIIEEPEAIPISGTITSWNYYASRPGTFQLMVWRLQSEATSDATFELIGYQEVDVQEAGAVRLEASTPIEVKAGDFLAIFYPVVNPIPFTFINPCLDTDPKHSVTYAVNQPSSMMVGSTINAPTFQTGLCRQYSVQVEISPDSSVLNGHYLRDRPEEDTSDNWLLIIEGPEAISTNGTITSWNYYASRPGTFQLMVWRRQSGTTFELIGYQEEDVQEAGAVRREASTPLEVKAGDILGIYYPVVNPIPFTFINPCLGMNPEHSVTYAVNQPTTYMTVGSTIDAPTFQTGLCRQYSIQVEILPEETDEESGDSEDEKLSGNAEAGILHTEGQEEISLTANDVLIKFLVTMVSASLLFLWFALPKYGQPNQRDNEDPVDTAVARQVASLAENMEELTRRVVEVHQAIDVQEAVPNHVNNRLDDLYNIIPTLHTNMKLMSESLSLQALDQDMHRRQWPLLIQGMKLVDDETGSMLQLACMSLAVQKLGVKNATKDDMLTCYRSPESTGTDIIVSFKEMRCSNHWLAGTCQLKAAGLGISVSPHLPQALKPVMSDLLAKQRDLPVLQKDKAYFEYLPGWPYIELMREGVTILRSTVSKQDVFRLYQRLTE